MDVRLLALAGGDLSPEGSAGQGGPPGVSAIRAIIYMDSRIRKQGKGPAQHRLRPGVHLAEVTVTKIVCDPCCDPSPSFAWGRGRKGGTRSMCESCLLLL